MENEVKHLQLPVRLLKVCVCCPQLFLFIFFFNCRVRRQDIYVIWVYFNSLKNSTPAISVVSYLYLIQISQKWVEKTTFSITFCCCCQNLPGHGWQSGVFWTFGPPQVAPPFNGIGLLQLRVRFCPIGDLPGQRHSVHCDHALQPPFTAKKRENNQTINWCTKVRSDNNFTHGYKIQKSICSNTSQNESRIFIIFNFMTVQLTI